MGYSGVQTFSRWKADRLDRKRIWPFGSSPDRCTDSKDIRLVAFPVGYVFGLLHWHKNGGYLGFTLDSVRSPSDAYSLDTRTLAVERWMYSEKGTINTDSFVEPKLIR